VAALVALLLLILSAASITSAQGRSPFGAAAFTHSPLLGIFSETGGEEEEFEEPESTGESSGLGAEGEATAPERVESEPPPFPAPLEPPTEPPAESQVRAPANLPATRTAYADLPDSAAVSLAERTFHVQTPRWSQPGSQPHREIVRYLSEHSAIEKRPNGKSVFVQSTVPLTRRDPAGKETPVSLTLHRAGARFAPANPLVPVAISSGTDAEVGLPNHVSFAPAATRNTGPTLAGNRLVWPNVAQDTDYMAEPIPRGVEVFWQLRSARSPEDSVLRFRLARGQKLVLNPAAKGAAELVEGSRRLALLEPPSASQADGHSIRATYSLTGDALTVHVNLTGQVDFPVLVDPVVVGYYGPGTYPNWNPFQAACGCYGFSAPSQGQLYVTAYGRPAETGNFGGWVTGLAGTYGEVAQVTRVDIQGVNHYTACCTYLEAGTYSNSTFNDFGNAVNSDNGTLLSHIQPGPLVTNAEFGNNDYVFCAHWAGGTDGSSQPLCNENYGEFDFGFGLYTQSSTPFSASTAIESAQVRYEQTRPPTAQLEAGHGVPQRWFNSQREGWVRVRGEDAGVGVSAVGIDASPGIVPADKMPKPSGSALVPGTSAYAPACGDPFCYIYLWAERSLAGLGTGVWTIAPWAHNGVSLEQEVTYKAYIDNTPPSIATPSWAGATLGNGLHELSFEASDTTGTFSQSGPAWIQLNFDGRPMYKKEQQAPFCNPPILSAEIPIYCHFLSGGWPLDSAAFAPGKHVVTLLTKDWAGNETSREFQVTIARPIGETQQAGPGAVNLQNGDYRIASTDASITAGVADLTVSRTYDSQATSASTPLGPGWTLSTPDAAAAGQWRSLQTLPNGSVEVETTASQKALFALGEHGWVSPAGYQSFTLTETSKSPAVYRITNQASDYTQFEQPSGATSFLPVLVGQAARAGGLNAVGYVIREGKTVEINSPEPAGVTKGACNTKPLETRGCRTLTLSYATGTTASGEAPSAWGEYKGQLAKIAFTAWDPASEAMKTLNVAQYAYDQQGRLRAEWDPRIEPLLKTTYGYDGRGRLVAVTQPGLEPYLFSYGTTSGAPGEAWLLAVTRPGASVALGSGSAPVNTTRPTLSSSTPTVGTTMSVASNGKWSNTPLIYVFQWQDCNASGTECASIPGATNATYTPTERDIGHTLLARVTAENGGGAQAASTLVTGVVPQGQSTNNPIPPAPAPGKNAITTIEYNVPVKGSAAPYQMGASEASGWGQSDPPASAAAIFPPDETQGWPAGGYTRASVIYFDSAGRRVNEAAPGGAITMAQYNAWDGVERSMTAGNRAAAAKNGMGEALATINHYSSDGTELVESLGPQHEVKLANGKTVQARAHSVFSYDHGAPGGEQYGLVTKSTEGALIVSGGTGEADVRTTTDSYSGQNGLGWLLGKPTAITTEVSAGKEATRRNVYDPTTGDITETTEPTVEGEGALTYTSQFGGVGSGAGKLSAAAGIAVDASENVWIADRGNHRIEEFSSTNVFLMAVGWGVADGKPSLETCASSCKAGISGSNSGQFSEPDGIAIDESNNAIYVGDPGNSRIDEFSTGGAFVRAFGWGVVDGKPEAETCTTACQAGVAGAGKGQLNEPRGVSSDAAGNLWVADSGNNRVEKFSEEGAYLSSYGKEGSGAGEFTGVGDVTQCKGNMYATDTGGNRVMEFSTAAKTVGNFGTPGQENGQFTRIAAIACSANKTLYVTDEASSRVERFDTAGAFLGSFGSQGGAPAQLASPNGVVIDAAGAVAVLDAGNNRVEVWAPGNPEARTTQTVYYTAKANTKEPSCGNRPEWANLPCETLPAGQPGGRLPALGATTETYTMLDQPASVTRTAGGATRTTSTSYDAAGRTQSVSVSASGGRPVATVTSEYRSQTGLPVKQSAAGASLTSEYNTLGQLVSYTDASGTESSYSYDVDGRITATTDGKGEDKYTYDTTTGRVKTLKDSAAGTFSATYNAAGLLEKQTYPNGMKATFSYDATGLAVGVTYAKGTAKWYEDTVTPSIHGQWLTQHTTLGEDTYTYDNVGRLVETQEKPTGKGCTTRLYEYNGGSNRIGETTRAPGKEGACTASGGIGTGHEYDEGGRLADPGISYEALGAVTAIPAGDAGGHPVETSYYASGAVYTQTQNGESKEFALDPEGRVLETATLTLSGSTTSISHYAGDSDAPSWTAEGTAGFTRRIAGIGGGVDAVQTAGGVTIELSNLHGDVIGSAPDLSTGKPALGSEPTAFGEPTSTSTPSGGLAWLGATGLQTELASGIAGTGGGGTYVPQIGATLEPAGLSESGLQDPVNEYLGDRTQAEPFSSSTGTLPGAIEPLPVNAQIEQEMWANPPWAPPPVNEAGPEEELDPLLTYSQAIAVAAVLRNGSNIAEGLSKLKIPALAGLILNAIASSAQPILNGLAYGLEKCYETLQYIDHHSARCHIWVGVKLGLPPFKGGSGICWASYKTRNHKREYTGKYPYCIDEWRFG
jgi:YD repeat-containing protein